MPFRAIIVAALISASSIAVKAEDCGNLKEIASLDLTPFGRGLFLAPININGTARPMLVSTAGGITSVTNAAVDTLGLHSLSASHLKMLDSSGNASQKFVV